MKEKIRISAASCARIRLNDFFLVEANMARWMRQNSFVLTPLGGGILVDSEAVDFIRSIGGDFEQSPVNGLVDLRAMIPDSSLGELIEWFNRCENREFGVMRELKEELCDEHEVMNELEGREVFAGRKGFWGHSTHHNLEGLRTFYFQEVFDVTLSPQSKAILSMWLEKNPPGIGRLFLLNERIIAEKPWHISDHCDVITAKTINEVISFDLIRHPITDQ